MIAPEHSNIVQMWGGEGRGVVRRERETERKRVTQLENGRKAGRKGVTEWGQRNERKKERLRENTK